MILIAKVPQRQCVPLVYTSNLSIYSTIMCRVLWVEEKDMMMVNSRKIVKKISPILLFFLLIYLNDLGMNFLC